MIMVPIQGRRVLLIGGAGFIGHNLALHLKKAGAEVSIIDGLQVNNMLALLSENINVGNRELYMAMINQRIALLRHAKIPMFVQDARDYHKLSQLISQIKPQTVVLLAAVAHAGRSNKDPFNTFDHSFRTLENSLDACRGSIEHFIFFSSSMVYGNFPDGIATEETICNPIGIYGALKLGGEKLVIAYNQVFGLPYTIVRPSALYGERCVSRRVGQIFIENALQDQDLVIRGDGSERLDFTYISDLAQGIKRVIENENSRNQIFNLTYGSGRSVADMIGILKDRFPKLNVKTLPRDELSPERGTLSVEKAKALLGYEPSFPLEKGMEKYIEWYKHFFAKYNEQIAEESQIYE
ncbi:MAG: NAD(P)-dependent oxidoreductase [Candidatus Riflebacteria bacterium]|nr:NAD(P)-dependent oxidoreductase [Candidatus Riflebacteria bacterium]